nr:hypothetical protein [Tanacetum cinerariifolium]
MTVEESVAQAKEEATLTTNGKENVCDDDISVTRVVDKGKWNVDNGKRNVDKGKGKMVDDDNVVNTRKIGRSSNSGKERLRQKKTPTPSRKNRNTQEAGCSRHKRVYDVGESYTMIEHEEYMEKLMYQLRDVTNDLTDPFTILENEKTTK